MRVFKTGPDFIDPTILEVASGGPVYQLDFEDVRRSALSRSTEISLPEGTLRGHTFHFQKLKRKPFLLLVARVPTAIGPARQFFNRSD